MNNKIDLNKLHQELESKLNTKIRFHYDNNDEITTFYFESETFELSFWIENKIFTIGSLEVFDEGKGIARVIINQIIEFCDELNFNHIIANKVKKDKFQFWEKFEFQSDDENCYYEL